MPADIEQMEAHRRALAGHCYRMLGSAVDADDAAQEAIIRAWRSLDQFDGRAALRTWLYRMATNVGLDELAHRSRRARPMEEAAPGATTDPLIQRPSAHWLEPIADARAIPADADPAERAILRQSIRLAFVAALQHLPPKQHAVFLLVAGLCLSPPEGGGTLCASVAPANNVPDRSR